MECGSCTMCCKLLVIKEANSPLGELCQYCEEGVGCKIYKSKPESCNTYQCMWSQMENAGMELRPDKSHIIFDKISDRTICALQDVDYELSPLVMDQIMFFNREGFSVAVIKGKEKILHKRDGHIKEEIIKELYDHEKRIMEK